MQAGEECGFHGNRRKAELWVSVPALHCTGPRLSAASLCVPLSYAHMPAQPLYLSPISSSLYPDLCNSSTTSPPLFMQHGSLPLLSFFLSRPLSLFHTCTLREKCTKTHAVTIFSSHKHTDSVSLQPLSLSPSFS